jgi:hypothetical protein
LKHECPGGEEKKTHSIQNWRRSKACLPRAMQKHDNKVVRRNCSFRNVLVSGSEDYVKKRNAEKP